MILLYICVILQCSDPPTTVNLTSNSERPRLTHTNPATVELRCKTGEFNGNCSIKWNTGSIRASKPKDLPNSHSVKLHSAINIEVERNNIGTNVTCRVLCDLIDTTSSAKYTVVADCKSVYNYFLSGNTIHVKVIEINCTISSCFHIFLIYFLGELNKSQMHSIFHKQRN